MGAGSCCSFILPNGNLGGLLEGAAGCSPSTCTYRMWVLGSPPGATLVLG